ncbi:MAG: hypothetical protein M3P42_03340 [Actinomycetota bacterium]|nr:hypothetical protein [Actinomycetota bacterium]
MRILRPISEDEMIGVFLRAELGSGRYGEKLRGLLNRDGRDLDVLRRPDLDDSAANGYRRGLFDEHRAYERRDDLFGGFPQRISWFRAVLSRDEVLEILYINWDWWLRISDGTRRPRDAARRIMDGLVPGSTAEEHEPLAAALRRNPRPPELIVATTPAHLPLVLVEGHFRLTAYALFPDYVPDELEVLLGVSDEMPEWCQF